MACLSLSLDTLKALSKVKTFHFMNTNDYVSRRYFFLENIFPLHYIEKYSSASIDVNLKLIIRVKSDWFKSREESCSSAKSGIEVETSEENKFTFEFPTEILNEWRSLMRLIFSRESEMLDIFVVVCSVWKSALFLDILIDVIF